MICEGTKREAPALEPGGVVGEERNGAAEGEGQLDATRSWLGFDFGISMVRGAGDPGPSFPPRSGESLGRDARTGRRGRGRAEPERPRPLRWPRRPGRRDQ